MRSKTLLISNIVASVYSVLLSWFFIGMTIVDAGGKSVINALGGFLESLFEIIHMDLAITNYLYVLGILSLIHLGLFVIGGIVSWVAYAKTDTMLAMVAAIIFVISTVCSPIGFIFGIPVSVLTFISVSNQKKLNK